MSGKRLFSLGVLAGILLLLGLLIATGADEMWRPWNLPVLRPSFADLQTIAGASESLAQGLDPLVSNPGDPWGRPLNYPRIWLLLSGVINEQNTVYFGIATAALFFASLLLFVAPTIDRCAAGILLACVFSPAVLLGVERGNTDLVVFALLCLTILFISKSAVAARPTAIAALLAASILKLYPIFALPLILREGRRRFALLAAVIVGIAGLYFIATYPDLVLIRRNTPEGIDHAYGIHVLWNYARQTAPALASETKILSYVVVAFTLLMAYTWVAAPDEGAMRDTGTHVSPQTMDAFRVGSGVYVGTFLLGSNWDYRMVFLLFTIPQLSAWMKSDCRPARHMARTVTVAMLLSLWSLVVEGPLSSLNQGASLTIYFDEFASWTVFAGLACLLAFTAPGWVRDLAERYIPMKTSRRGALLLLLATLLGLSTAGTAYMTAFASSYSAANIGPYSPTRLTLIACSLLAALALAAVLVKASRSPLWSSRLADAVYRHAHRLLLLGALLAGLGVVLLVLALQIAPGLLARISAPRIERLLPYFLAVPSTLLTYLFTYRLQRHLQGTSPDP